MNNTCPICEKGTLKSSVELNKVEYKGVIGLLRCDFSTCSHCDSDQTTSEQSKNNKLRKQKFDLMIDGLSNEQVSLLEKQGYLFVTYHSNISDFIDLEELKHNHPAILKILSNNEISLNEENIGYYSSIIFKETK